LPPMTPHLDLVQGDFLTRVAQWNIVMVLFNMIPAFPMDGGRVLRAGLAMMTDYGKATRWAAAIGQGFAVFGAIAALFLFQNPLLLIVAMFIFLSAGQEASMVKEDESARGLTVRDAMVTEFHSLREGSTLQEAVDRLLSGTQHDFPVVNREGEFTGLLTRTALISALAKHGAQHYVSEVMEPLEIKLDPRQALKEGLEQLRVLGLPAIPVLDPLSGKIAGLLTTENIGEMLMIRAALGRTA
jgi:CBS domain-containing protein